MEASMLTLLSCCKDPNLFSFDPLYQIHDTNRIRILKLNSNWRIQPGISRTFVNVKVDWGTFKWDSTFDRRSESKVSCIKPRIIKVKKVLAMKGQNIDFDKQYAEIIWHAHCIKETKY